MLRSTQFNILISYLQQGPKSGKAIQDAYKAGFVYEKEYDRFVCPEGRYLNPYEFIDIDNERKYYRSKSSDCARCVQKEDCSAL